MLRQPGRRTLLVGLGSMLGLAWAAHAAEPQSSSPDAEFLEYLGSGDDAEPELQQYLTKPEVADARDVKSAPKRGSERT
jgi:hypothetical protein